MKRRHLLMLIFAIFHIGTANAEQITEHFRREEFNQKRKPLPLSQVKVRYSLVQMLEVVRIAIGNKPIIINSGYRTPEYNVECGGVEDSQHLLGLAADIRVKGMTPAELGRKAKEVGFDFVQVYGTFVHVDVRYHPGDGIE